MIDDSELDQFILDKLMAKYNLFRHKQFCYDAESAINEIEKNLLDHQKLPDVIFLDLIMPHFDGFDFLERFSKLYPVMNKIIDIFIITSSIDPRDRKKSEKYHFVKKVLVKPLNCGILTNIYARYKPGFMLN